MQILLPVFDNTGSRFDDGMLAGVRQELTDRFGGVTAYLRSPASGAWQRGDGSVDRDQMVMVEVMTDDLDPEWWAQYRAGLEARFQQDVIIVRVLAARRI